MFPLNESDKLIFVNIKKSYGAILRNDKNDRYHRDSLYDCTVKYWRVAEHKALSATHILGCYKGEVIEVVKIKGTPQVIYNYDNKRRWVFDGTEQLDSEYMHKDIRELFDNLANFNVKYWNL
ncbi:MAG: hypothetical protein IKR18_02515 [Bacteroidaceae bacterium]|nr:hypothetical protein [Bacteroidaceae bacterium]